MLLDVNTVITHE